MVASLRLIQFSSWSESKSVCCVSFILSCGCRWASLPDLALVVTEGKLDMEIVLPLAQENLLKATATHTFITKSHVFILLRSSVCCATGAKSRYQHIFSSRFLSLVLPSQTLWCLKICFPALWVDVVDPEAGRRRPVWPRILQNLTEGGFVRAACSCWPHCFAQYYRWRWALHWKHDFKRFLSLPEGLREYVFVFKPFFFSWMPNYSLLKHFAQNKQKLLQCHFFILSTCKNNSEHLHILNNNLL